MSTQEDNRPTTPAAAVEETLRLAQRMEPKLLELAASAPDDPTSNSHRTRVALDRYPKDSSSRIQLCLRRKVDMTQCRAALRRLTP